ncbi:hypothetical protein F5Y13DRAFT_168714 [Hypoxylon sp. FL1857]|nr:hypothetical protein F5Y13DRAFT_168714 [Hypoxylon sp. FL1857]
MLEAVPLSYYSDRTGNDYVQVPMINMGARERAKDLADAKLAFEGFLATRKQIIRDVISNTFMWRQYADSENMEYLLKIADPTNKNAENEVKYNAVRTAAYARRLASNLSQVQSNTWLPVIDLTTSQVEAAYRNVTSARDYERQFINTLLTKSAKAGLWDGKRYADVMSQLWMNMGKTLRASENIGQTLQRINGGWSSLGTKAKTPEEAALLWARVARDLLRNWVMVLMNSQEGILFSLRRNQYTAAGQGPDFDRSESDVSWEAWKNRNCGGTSCYDVEGRINSLMTKLGVSMKPLAGRAKDEVEWKAKVGARGSKVWRKTYEEACCVDGDLAEFLKYVPSGTIDAFGRPFGEW